MADNENNDTSRNEQRNAILDELDIDLREECWMGLFPEPTGMIVISLAGLTRLLDALIDARHAK